MWAVFPRLEFIELQPSVSSIVLDLGRGGYHAGGSWMGVVWLPLCYLVLVLRSLCVSGAKLPSSVHVGLFSNLFDLLL